LVAAEWCLQAWWCAPSMCFATARSLFEKR
jgi:hypothetical protein